MNCRRNIIWLGLFAVAVTATLEACQKPEPEGALPREAPQPAVLEFGGAEGGWPPLPVGAKNVTLIASSGPPVALTEALGLQLQQAALADTQVRQALGERFAFISIDEQASDKNGRPQAAEDLATRLTYFSHENNVAVEVRMQGSKVADIERRAGYQPPEGADEIDRAIQLARQDAQLRETVADMEASALVAFPREDQPGYGNRVLYVSFAKAGTGLAEYMALVDLTAEKILAAGPVGGP